MSHADAIIAGALGCQERNAVIEELCRCLAWVQCTACTMRFKQDPAADPLDVCHLADHVEAHEALRKAGAV